MSESTPEDRLEQESTATRDAETREAPSVPLEAPAADVVEQATAAGPGEHRADEGGSAGAAGGTPLEADPADAAEQAVVVELDEDERR